MDQAELEAWVRSTDVATVLATGRLECEVMACWRLRIDDLAELRDLSSFAGAAGLSVPALICAGGRAAVELAIICSVWPAPLDLVVWRGPQLEH